MSKQTDDLKAQLLRKRSKTPIAAKDLLSTGSTLLNLAASGKAQGGLFAGGTYYFVGDSSSGKTWFALSILAEASISKRFDKHKLIYDPAENGALMDVANFFGERLAKRIQTPAAALDVKDTASVTVEQMLDYVTDLAKEGPFVYIMDSLDALETEADQESYAEAKAARAKGKAAGGSYGTAKAKALSAAFRKINNACKDTGSIFVAISQTRDNIGFGAQFNPKTRSGGRAPTFYTQLEIWTSVKERIKKDVLGKKRTIGTLVLCKVKKNRLTGANYDVLVPILNRSGIDDTGSMVAWLIEEGRWSVSKGKVDTGSDWGIGPMPVEDWIKYIEGNDLTSALVEMVADTWERIELASAADRKPRYQ